MISATYFDGRSARLHQVELSTSRLDLTITGNSVVKTYPLHAVRLAEPFAQAPCVLDFDDGARCEVADAADKKRLCRALGYRQSRIEQWQERWWGALLALVLLVLVLAATVEWGIPAVAEALVARLPATLDDQIGKEVLQAMEGRALQPSRLSDQRIAEIEGIFNSIKPATPRRPVRLLVRNAPSFGTNAFALPDGTIVLTDAMLLQVLGKQVDLGKYEADQLMGIFAHEIGHIEHRHSLRAIGRSSLTLALSATLFGDFSALAAGAPALLVNMEYSREMETEADNYGIALLKYNGISPLPLADLFEALMHSSEAAQRNLPRWLRSSMAYASSHPRTDERVQWLRDSADLPPP